MKRSFNYRQFIHVFPICVEVFLTEMLHDTRVLLVLLFSLFVSLFIVLC